MMSFKKDCLHTVYNGHVQKVTTISETVCHTCIFNINKMNASNRNM